MDLSNISGYTLTNLDRRNVVLGKNGCGKSRLLKQLEQGLRSNADFGAVKYLSPERGGLLQYEAGIEQNLSQNETWLADTRRRNRAEQFRQQSAAQFRRLELLTLREIESNPQLRNDPAITFDTTVEQINTLLDRVYIARADPAFRIYERQTQNSVSPDDVSSGESELISLGIECLVFERECKESKINLLLIDEPDVHLHPDLQSRFVAFLDKLLESNKFYLLIATHSTALLGAMSIDERSRLCFMKYGQTTLEFRQTNDVHKKVLPVFGAHPLSNVFNQAPVLLLEGDDDERIWQQAVRSAEGRIKVYPCSVESVTNLNSFEQEVAQILESVYDQAIGYSLRDRDDNPEEIDDVGPVRRMRLNWRTAENLLLTDEVLSRCGLSWDQFQTRVETWLSANPEHPHYAEMKAFSDTGFDRANADLKQIRNDLVGLMGTNKPWEVLVGQEIARLNTNMAAIEPFSLSTALGQRMLQLILTGAKTENVG